MTADAAYSLLKELDRYSDSDLPPVEDWHPQERRDILLRIDRSGRWFLGEEQINDQRMVRRFSTVLRKEESSYYLVTPAAKRSIEVEDVPFVAVLMDVVGEGSKQSLRFETNVGDLVTLNDSHPLRLQINPIDEPSPYIRVRHELEAILTRDVYYQLADLLVADASSTMLGVWSEGAFTALCKATAVF